MTTSTDPDVRPPRAVIIPPPAVYPSKRCETVCFHDTSRGVLMEELLGDHDGPDPPPDK